MKKRLAGLSKVTVTSLLAASLIAPNVASAAPYDIWNGTIKVGNLKDAILNDDSALLQDILDNANTYRYELGGKTYLYSEADAIAVANPNLTPTELDNKIATDLADKAENAPEESTDLVVQSVSAITTAVASGSLTTPQFVELTVNDGKVVTLDDLKEAGYTVEFQASKSIFTGDVSSSATGELKNNLTAADNFSYQVIITKGETTVKSTLVSVTVRDSGKIVTPTELSLTLDASGSASAWEIPYITINNNGVDEEKVSVIVSKGLDFAGKEVDANQGTNAHLPETLAQEAIYTSSDQQVALISNQGEVTPIGVGTTTITVKIGEQSLSLPLEVKEASEATAIKETSITKAVGSNVTIDLTVLDQYGEALRKNSGTLTVTTESGKTDVISGLASSTSVKEKLSLTSLTLAKGTDTLIVKDGDTILGKVKVDVVDTANGTVDGYKIVAQSGKDLELDVYGSDNTVNIEFQEYVGTVQKGNNLVVPASGFSVKSTNPEVATVSSASGSTTVTAVKEGMTTIQYLQGSIVVAEETITVKNSTPQITDITLKEGKEAIEVNGNVSANKSVIADIFDELDVKFVDGATTMDLNGTDLTLKEIASIIESNGNITLNTHDGSAAATATTENVVGNQTGSLAIKVADNYGGQTFVFDVVVKDVTKPTISTTTLTTAGTKATLQVGGDTGVNITAKNVGTYGNDIKVVVEANADDTLVVSEDTKTKTVTIKYANVTASKNTGTLIASAASSLTLVDVVASGGGAGEVGSTHDTTGTNLANGVDQVIDITFSEKMDKTTLSQIGDITIKDSGDSITRTIESEAAILVWNAECTILTISINNSSVISTDKITATNAKDISGNAVDIISSTDVVFN